MDTQLTACCALRVLVIDSDVDTAESTAFLLRLDGHDVRTTSSGAVALRVAEAYEPDVVLMELGLADMDGYTVARRLRDRRAEMRPILIAVTGHGTIEERQRSADAGIHLHLVKPVDPALLAGLLEQFDSKRHAMQTV